MNTYLPLGLLLLLIACTPDTKDQPFIFSGQVDAETTFVRLGNDTFSVRDGQFADTLLLESGRYEYVQLSTWKWPKLIYIDNNTNLEVDFSQPFPSVDQAPLNAYLLHLDSVLQPYTLRWDMEEAAFRSALTAELETNLHRIDSIFPKGALSPLQLSELKQLEQLKVAHRTANFISFQARNGHTVNRDIYDFVKGIDLNNPRLEQQLNNRNFQYFYLLDKVSDTLPPSVYPFAVIDTVNRYSTLESIRKMIITAVVKASFYEEEVDHDQLLAAYEANFGSLAPDHELFRLHHQIQQLQPGQPAPSFGSLENVDGSYTTLEDLKGKPILLSVWGTWCPYCRAELPYLQALTERYGDRFTSVGIALDRDPDAWKTHLAQTPWEGVHLIDPERKSTFKTNYLLRGTNIHLLIDQHGIIRSSRTLKPSSEELEALIKKLDHQ